METTSSRAFDGVVAFFLPRSQAAARRNARTAATWADKAISEHGLTPEGLSSLVAAQPVVGLSATFDPASSWRVKVAIPDIRTSEWPAFCRYLNANLRHIRFYGGASGGNTGRYPLGSREHELAVEDADWADAQRIARVVTVIFKRLLPRGPLPITRPMS